MRSADGEASDQRRIAKRLGFCRDFNSVLHDLFGSHTISPLAAPQPPRVSIIAGQISAIEIEEINLRITTLDPEFPLPLPRVAAEANEVIPLASAGLSTGMDASSAVPESIPAATVASGVPPDVINALQRLMGFGPNDRLDDEQWKFIHQCHQAFLNGTTLRLFLQGGPGTGKTHVVNLVQRLTDKPFLCSAFSGSAASNFPGGSTISNLLGLNLFNPDRQLSSATRLSALGANNQLAKRNRLYRVYIAQAGVGVIDEISFLGATALTHYSNRLKDVQESPTKRVEPFADCNMIVLGDFDQLLPIGGVSIPTAIFNFLIVPNRLRTAQDLDGEGAVLFMAFRRIKLKKQNRAILDVNHTARMAAMCDYSIKHPVTIELIAYLNSILLRPGDVADPASPWNTESTWLTASNVERCMINFTRCNVYAKREREVLFRWPLQPLPDFVAVFTDEELLQVQDAHPEISGYFCRGAPCVLLDNVKPEKSLSNGTQCHMHSLIFDEANPLYDQCMRLINGAPPGECVDLPIAPKYIVVEIEPKHGFVFPENQRLPLHVARPANPANICIAVLNPSPKTGDDIKCISIGDRVVQLYRFKKSSVELMFACTFEKSQGKTLKYVILCLHENPWNTATWRHVFVGLSRVDDSSHLRVMPARNGLNLERFLTVQHDLPIVLLDQAYNDEGVFQESRYRAAYQAHLDAIAAAPQAVPIRRRHPGGRSSGRLNGRSGGRPGGTDGRSGGRASGGSDGRTGVSDGRSGGRAAGGYDGRTAESRRSFPSDGAEGVSHLTYIATLRSQPTLSWAFIPWLRCVFDREDDNVGPLPLELQLLRQHWPRAYTIEQEILFMRHAFLMLNLIGPVRDRFLMHLEGGGVYIPSVEQEYLLGDFAHAPDGVIGAIYDTMRAAANAQQFLTISIVGDFFNQALTNFRNAPAAVVDAPALDRNVQSRMSWDQASPTAGPLRSRRSID